MKCVGKFNSPHMGGSLSLRRAWIEIYRLETLIRETKGRSPYGERGLKFIGDMALQKDVVSLSLRRAWIEIARTWEPTRRPDGRSPYGERGLKSRLALHRPTARLSLSLRRAWIEIAPHYHCSKCESSLSLRRAWIEIPARYSSPARLRVALLTESVD